MAKQNMESQLADLREKLRDPLRLRLLIAACAVIIGYLGIFSTLDSRIAATKRQLKAEERRAKTANEVELLQAQYEGFQSRLHKDADVNEWVQFVLDGVRQRPVKLVNLDVAEERRVSPYKALVLRLHVNGDMQHIDQLIAWIESNDRLFRIDTMTIDPDKNNAKHRSLQMTLLALKA